MIPSELNEVRRILSDDTVFLENTAELYTTRSIQRRRIYQDLVNRYYRQIRYGCHNALCETPTCLSCLKRKAKGPFRRLTILSARILASFLASQDNPEQKLCPYPAASPDSAIYLEIPKKSSEDEIYASEIPEQLVEQDENDSAQSIIGLQEKEQTRRGKQAHMHESAVESKSTYQMNRNKPNTGELKMSKDPKSLSQKLYDTKSWRVLQNLVFEQGVLSWVPITHSGDDFDMHIMRIDAKEDFKNLQLTTNMSCKDSVVSESAGNSLQQSRLSSFDRLLTLSHFTTANINALWRLTSATRCSNNREIAFIKSLGLTIPYSRVSLLRGISSTPSDIIAESSFALQSIVYVLSTSSALLQSFKQNGHNDMERENTPAPYSDMIIAFRQLGDIESHPCRVFPSLWVSLGDTFATDQYSRVSAFQRHSSTKTLDSFSTSPRSIGPSINNDDLDMMTDENAAHIIKVALAALVASVPRVNSYVWEDVVQLRSSGRVTPYDPSFGVYSMESLQAVMDSYEDELALNLMTRLVRAFGSRRCYSQVVETRENAQADDSSMGERNSDIAEAIVSFMHDDGRILPLAPTPIELGDIGKDVPRNSEGDDFILYRRQSFSAIVLEWVRTVLLKEWDGKPEVLRWNIVGSCLDLMNCLYRNREELNLVERDFCTPFFSARLDAAEMPVEWLSSPSRRETVHLLSYPFLFQPSTLVMYFRAINYASMFKAFETSYTMTRMMYQMSQVSSRNQDRLFNSLRTAMTNNLVLEIRRNNILTDALDQLWRREKRELLRPLKVRMGMDEGEEGVDLGGVQQEFFRIAIGQALNPDFGLFTTNARNRMSWFQPCSLEPLYKFELLGLLVSLAVYNGLTLPVTFPIALYRKILDLPLDALSHIQDGWPELAKGLKELLDWPSEDIEDVFVRSYIFSIEALGITLHVDMENVGREGAWPSARVNGIKERQNATSFELQQSQEVPKESSTSSGSIEGSDGWIAISHPITQSASIDASNHHKLSQSSSFQLSQWTSYSSETSMVNNANREDYVKDYIYWLTDKSIRPQYDAFLRGFLMCIDRKTISMFSAEALRTLVEGIQEIDVQQLEQVAKYDGYSAEHRVIKDFWSVVHNFTSTQVRRLLEFVTASDRIPVNGVRSIAFVIQKNGTDDERLPTSTTCFGRLLLPEYTSKERLEERLCLAMENCHGFGNG